MSDVVFILGAGASRHMGAPLMYDFLDVAMDQRKTLQNTPIEKDYSKVFDAIAKLQIVHSKS